MFIISVLYPIPSTQTPIKVMEIEFENDKVKQTTVRQ